MPTISGKDFCKVLEGHEWEWVRTHGSHHVYKKAGVPENISVPVHGNTPLKKGLLHKLMRVAELTDEDL